MKHGLSITFTALRLLTLALACAVLPAQADEYGDVSQMVRNGKLAEAMVRADTYLAAKPRDPQMRFVKGVIQRNMGKNAEAISTFTKLNEDYPELSEPYNNLAVIYAGQGQLDKARAALEMAIRTNPDYATAHENLGDVYARLASRAYGKALQLDSANASLLPKMALIHELLDSSSKGVRASAVAAPSSAPAAPSTAPAAPSTAPAASKPGATAR